MLNAFIIFAWATAGLIIASIFIPQIDVIFGSIFDSWQNTLLFCIGMFLLYLVAIALSKLGGK